MERPAGRGAQGGVHREERAQRGAHGGAHRVGCTGRSGHREARTEGRTGRGAQGGAGTEGHTGWGTQGTAWGFLGLSARGPASPAGTLTLSSSALGSLPTAVQVPTDSLCCSGLYEIQFPGCPSCMYPRSVSLCPPPAVWTAFPGRPSAGLSLRAQGSLTADPRLRSDLAPAPGGWAVTAPPAPGLPCSRDPSTVSSQLLDARPVSRRSGFLLTFRACSALTTCPHSAVLVPICHLQSRLSELRLPFLMIFFLLLPIRCSSISHEHLTQLLCLI